MLLYLQWSPVTLRARAAVITYVVRLLKVAKRFFAIMIARVITHEDIAGGKML